MQYPHEEALSEMKKEELIAFLKEAMGLPEEGGDKKGGKGIVKIPKSIVKARIRDLKGKKKEALTSNNHKRAGILTPPHQSVKKALTTSRLKGAVSMRSDEAIDGD